MVKDIYYFKKLRAKYVKMNNQDGIKAMDEIIKQFSVKKEDKQMTLK